MSSEDDRFDSWLERRLKTEFDPVTRQPAPRRPRYREEGRTRARRLPLFSGLGAAVVSKAAVGVTVTAFAVGVGGAAVETAVTGSPLPPVVEQQVAGAVQSFVEQPGPVAQASPTEAAAEIHSGSGQAAGREREPSPDGRRPAALPATAASHTPEASSHPTPASDHPSPRTPDPEGSPEVPPTPRSPEPRPGGSHAPLPVGSPSPIPSHTPAAHDSNGPKGHPGRVGGPED